MIFSFFEPVIKLVNKKVQTSLKAMQTRFGFVSYAEFCKDGGTSAKLGKGVETSKSNAKLVRIGQDKILPKEGKRNILITSALPYVNNVPHLGNIIGCVLSADVYARFARQAGHNALYICGTDEYGTATETKAQEAKKTCREICDEYNAIHQQVYDWFDCDFDLFGRTTSEKHKDITQDIFKDLYDQGRTFEKEIEQLFCGSCDRFLADRYVRGECPLCHGQDAKGDQCDSCGKLLNATELIKPSCTTCNASPELRKTTHIFIDLPAIQPELEQWIKDASKNGKWSSNSLSFTNALLEKGLIGRCITRDLKWGTPVPLEKFSHKVFYVWFDAPIGYLSITANYTDEWKQWW
jgi:methionyl-tRNA synthetase